MIFAIGNLVSASLEAHDLLARDGIALGVVDMYCIRPIDQETILSAARTNRVIFTAEEHNVTGGFGAAVAEVIATAGATAKLHRIGIPDEYSLLGPPTHLYQHYGLNGAGIAKTVKTALDDEG